MIKKLFHLWDKHTTGFVRVLFALMIPSAIFEDFAILYCLFLMILWLIVKTGYEKKWNKTE